MTQTPDPSPEELRNRETLLLAMRARYQEKMDEVNNEINQVRLVLRGVDLAESQKKQGAE